MDSYRAPLEDMTFIIDELLEAESALGSLPQFADCGVGPDLTTALLDEAAKLAGDVLTPLRRVGDEHPATCADGKVTVSPGYDGALQQMAAGGWVGIAADANYGGQGLPELYSTATHEMWNSGNIALALAPLLSSSAALAIAAHGSEAQKQTYLEKMHTGEWFGTMNLTESGAGSDLGVMKTRAVPEGDHYRITGRKYLLPGVTTRPPTISCTWCWPSCPGRPRAVAVFRCSSCPSTWSMPTAHSVSATMFIRCPASTNWGFTAAPPV